MNRRNFLKTATVSGGILVFTPAQIFADKLFYTEDVDNIINLTPYGPMEAVNIISFFSKVVKGVSALKTTYDIFSSAHGALKSSNWRSGWGYDQRSVYNYKNLREIAFPTTQHDPDLYSGSNNYMMPVVNYNQGLQYKAFVGGPHLVGLGMLCEGMRSRTSSASKTADRLFPVGQSDEGNFSFQNNSYSDLSTDTGNVRMHYQNHGSGKGSITASITCWDSDAGHNVNDNVNIDVRYA